MGSAAPYVFFYVSVAVLALVMHRGRSYLRHRRSESHYYGNVWSEWE